MEKESDLRMIERMKDKEGIKRPIAHTTIGEL